MIEQFGARAIAAIVFVVALVALIIFGVSQCEMRRTAEKQAEVSKEQGQASVRSGAEAMNTVSNVAAGDAATDAQVAEGEAAIRAAPEGQKGKVTAAEACRFKAYANTPRCKEQAR